MTPESKVKAMVRAKLKSAGAYVFMPVQTGMGAPTLDFIGCHRGRFFGIETKATKGKATQRQYHTASLMVRAGGVVFLLRPDPEKLWIQPWVLLQQFLDDPATPIDCNESFPGIAPFMKEV
jgi:hypothetical protein